jgi:pyrroloquinoline quinone biosynthesis protein E
VQLSIQDVDPANADRIAAYKGGMEKKNEVAKWVKELDMPLTINAPLHRQNIDNLPAIIDYAVKMGAGRLEVAHIQYYAWALKNRAALMPTREAFMKTNEIVEEARERLKGILVIDFVVPDYYAKYPKPCMGGWGRGIINVTPSGKVLPCHAAESLPGLEFDNVRERSLSDIWLKGQAFEKYRGTEWMKEPCRSCPRKEIDFGGCRCQAFALTGDATNTDPACSLSPMHEEWAAKATEESHTTETPEFIYRRMGAATASAE